MGHRLPLPPSWPPVIIVGISAFYHDSAVCVVADGRVVAAAQEERFSRKKHDSAFPLAALRSCLETAQIHARDVDVIAYYEKPFRKFDRLLSTQLAYAPRGFRAFQTALPLWLKQKLRLRRRLVEGWREAGGEGTAPKLVFPSHHESHAASAFYPSPFESAAVLTIDGVGEWDTAAIGQGAGASLDILETQRFPHSLGLFYSACTAYCGFRVNNGEYKLMGLAPYGEPRYVEELKKVVAVDEAGGVRLDMDYFAFGYSSRSTTPAFDALLGGPARRPDQPLSQRFMDVARSAQVVTEEAVLAMARHAQRRTGERNLVMAGGVALNCVANGRVTREAGFEGVWIQPAAGDAGGALGAALFAHHRLFANARTPQEPDTQHGSLLGPSFDANTIDTLIDERGWNAERYETDAALFARIAELLDDGQIVGHFAGRMEYGPRALGARSILADPRDPTVQRRLNLAIKFRESFRPFAPVVLAEEADAVFDLDGRESPYMLIVAPVAASLRRTPDESLVGLERVNAIRSTLPAITHVDGSARVQTVDSRHGRLRPLLEHFHRRTGCPVLVNTSFNVRGEPIVCTPEDAARCFEQTNMDVLVLEHSVVVRSAQPMLGVVESPPPEELERDEPAEHLVGLEWSPPTEKLARFGVASTLVFGAIGAMLWTAQLGGRLTSGVRESLAVTLWTIAVFSLIAAVARPRWNVALWRAIALIAWPIGRVVSSVALALVFYGVFTPIGAWLRLRGRDTLGRGGDADGGWQPAPTSPAPSRYLRQY